MSSTRTFTEDALLHAAARVAVAGLGGPDPLLAFTVEEARLVGARPADSIPEDRSLTTAWVTPPAYHPDGDELISTCHARLCKTLAVARNRGRLTSQIRPSLEALNRGAEQLAAASAHRWLGGTRLAFRADDLGPVAHHDPSDRTLWIDLDGLPTGWDEAVAAACGRILIARAGALLEARRQTRAPGARPRPARHSHGDLRRVENGRTRAAVGPPSPTRRRPHRIRHGRSGGATSV